jgi:hypothetical protein
VISGIDFGSDRVRLKIGGLVSINGIGPGVDGQYLVTDQRPNGTGAGSIEWQLLPDPDNDATTKARPAQP